jgi:hypothetical protein
MKGNLYFNLSSSIFDNVCSLYSLKESRSKVACLSLNKQIECYFECLIFILKKSASNPDDVDYCILFIDNHVSIRRNRNKHEMNLFF